MTIGNIIHLILRGNQISILSKLKDIFIKVG